MDSRKWPATNPTRLPPNPSPCPGKLPCNAAGDRCSACNSESKQCMSKSREKKRKRALAYTPQEREDRRALGMPDPTPLSSAKRPRLLWSDFSYARLRAVEKYYRKWGEIGSDYVYDRLGKEQSRQMFQKRFEALALRPTIGGKHNEARVLVLPAGRRTDDTEAVLLVRRLYDKMHREYKQLLRDYYEWVPERVTSTNEMKQCCYVNWAAVPASQ